MNVSFLPGCLCDVFYPRAAIAAVRVLEHIGCRVDCPAAATCCGQPMFNNGFRREARELARRVLRAFDGAEWVVTPSASCAAMIREHYPTLFATGTAGRRRAEALAARTREFAEFLVSVLRLDLSGAGAVRDGVVTWHPSCHQRAIGLTDETLWLLRGVRGVRFVPLANAEECCGFGGTFAATYAEISGAMVREKVDRIRASGATTVVCNEPGCTMNIAGACRRAGHAVRFVSVAELLAESLGLMRAP